MKRNTLVKKKVKSPTQLNRISKGRPRKMRFSKRLCYGRSCRKGMLIPFVSQQQMVEQFSSIDI